MMQANVDKCLAFCKTLVEANHKFTFTLTIDKDNLSFSTYDQPCKGSACKGRDLKTRAAAEEAKRGPCCRRCKQPVAGHPGGSKGCGASCTNLALTPEKLRQASDQGDLSLATPEKGGREEQCENCNNVMTPEHQCEEAQETVVDDLNKFKDQEIQTEPAQEEIQEIDLDNDIYVIQLCVPMYVRDKKYGLGTCVGEEYGYNFEDCTAVCKFKLLYPN
jgi:hypothetical protein